MPEEREEFVSMNESLDSIENIVSEIRSSMNNQDDENDFVSSERIEFIQAVKGINNTLSEMNGFLQNIKTSNFDDLTEPVEQPFLPEPPTINNQFTPEDSETSMLVEHLSSINQNLVDIKTDISEFKFNELVDKIQSTQQSVDTINIQPAESFSTLTPEDVSQIGDMNNVLGEINQEIKNLEQSNVNKETFELLRNSISDLQESISKINVPTTQGMPVTDQSFTNINWDEELIQPLQQIRRLVNEPVAKGNITEVLNGLSSDNLNMDKIHELEETLPNIVSSLKDFKLDPAAMNSLVEFEEKIKGLSSFTSAEKANMIDTKSIGKINNSISEINNTPSKLSQETVDVVNQIPLQTATEISVPEFKSESSDINVVNERITGGNIPGESMVFEGNTSAPMNDFVLESAGGRKALDQEASSNPINPPVDLNTQMSQLILLVQKQNDLLSKVMESKVEVSTDIEAKVDEKPLMEYGKPEVQKNDKTQAEATLMVMAQLASLMSDLNSSIAGLNIAVRTSKQSPLNLS